MLTFQPLVFILFVSRKGAKAQSRATIKEGVTRVVNRLTE
jgi:hypothetical protein